MDNIETKIASRADKSASVQQVSRSVHVFNDGWTHGALQQLYYDGEKKRLRPNTALVREDGTVLFEINEVGLKGDPIDPSRKLAVVWGDSVVFAIGQGWPALLNGLAPGYQFLNGGIEGDEYPNILQRAVALNRDADVSLNIIFPGWHPLDWRTSRFRRWLRPQNYNRLLARDLSNALSVLPNPVLMTIPTALNPRLLKQDMSGCFAPGNADEAFLFCGPLEYSRYIARDIFRHIVERNNIIREVAARLQLPLVDLYAALDTEGSSDFRRDFFDVQHPRPSAYPHIAEVVYRGISQIEWHEPSVASFLPPGR